MNYFAHALPHLDRPYFLAGLAVPDWLSVLDRQCRVRRRVLNERIPTLTGEELELARGILRHLDDDQWFHNSSAFYDVSGGITADFREVLGTAEEWHCGFLGHIVLELLIDATLIEDQPQAIHEYYRVMQNVDTLRVEQGVRSLATRDPVELGRFIELYLRERFLEDYTSDTLLLKRLNQVMRRVGLRLLPPDSVAVFRSARLRVRQQIDALLPPT
ncbi:hypothetical protein [Planctomicrobium sp. SH664]|uniref:hypothetical protein n=1 Tax=Planctomicrobium sp. SH664 TaxID=3448125 RepID=UPI003F5BCAF7